MAKLSDFFPYILPNVPLCPDVLAEQKIIDSCIEFCEQTYYWRYTHPPMPMLATVSDYELTLPSDAQVASIIEPINFNGEKVYGKTKEWLDLYEDQWEDKTGDKTRCYYNKSTSVIRVIPTPITTVASAIKLDVALKPLPISKTVKDFLFDEFYQVIANGALAKLYAMPEQRFHSLKLADRHLALFDDGIRKATVKAKSGFKTDQRFKRSRAHFF